MSLNKKTIVDLTYVTDSQLICLMPYISYNKLMTCAILFKDLWLTYSKYPNVKQYLWSKIDLLKKLHMLENEFILRNLKHNKNKKKLSKEFHYLIDKSLRKYYTKHRR